MRYSEDNRYLSPEIDTEAQRPKIVAPPPAYRPPEHKANFILIKLKPGTMDDVLEMLKKIKGISGFHPVFGEYDLVLIVRERNKFNRQWLMRKIWEMEGVVEVQTLLAAS